MLDLMKMMGKMKEVQARLKEAQESLEHVRVSGEAGAGLVKATVNGKKKLLQLDIDPSLIKADDKSILQDLIIAAVNKAHEEAEVQAREHLRKSTEGLLPNIPGMDFSNLFG